MPRPHLPFLSCCVARSRSRFRLTRRNLGDLSYHLNLLGEECPNLDTNTTSGAANSPAATVIPLKLQHPRRRDLQSNLSFWSDTPEPRRGPYRHRFVTDAKIVLPSLLDIVSRTDGVMSDLVVDIWCPRLSTDLHARNLVTVSLNGEVIDTRLLLKWYRRAHIFIPLHRIFKEQNELVLKVENSGAKSQKSLYHIVDFFLSSRRETFNFLEENCIWVFSSARSGSTWLASDILCWKNRARPMDETGLGKMVAPLRWVPEGLFALPQRRFRFESGYPFEAGLEPRKHGGVPPFERAFPENGGGELIEQIGSKLNHGMLRTHIRELALDHVIRVWGMPIDYERVVFKAPNDAHGADLIMAAMPRSFMIFLMRDGRDVVRSRFTPFASPDLAATTDRNLRLHAIAYYSHFWNFQVDIIRSAYEEHPPERRLLVRYEDLRRNPHTRIAAVLGQVGMSLAEEDLAELVRATALEQYPASQRGLDKPRQFGQTGGYKFSFSDEEIHLMNEIMGENLQRYGYFELDAAEAVISDGLADALGSPRPSGRLDSDDENGSGHQPGHRFDDPLANLVDAAPSSINQMTPTFRDGSTVGSVFSSAGSLFEEEIATRLEGFSKSVEALRRRARESSDVGSSR